MNLSPVVLRYLEDDFPPIFWPPFLFVTGLWAMRNFISMGAFSYLFSLSRCHPSFTATYNAPLTTIWAMGPITAVPPSLDPEATPKYFSRSWGNLARFSRLARFFEIVCIGLHNVLAMAVLSPIADRGFPTNSL